MCAITILLGNALSARAQSEQTSSRYEQNAELIVSLEIEQYLLGDTIALYRNDQLYFDFEELLTILEFPIERQGENYSGWFANQDNVFELSISAINQTMQLELREAEQQVTVDDFFSFNGINYVSVSFLNDVFKLNPNLDLENLKVVLNPSIELPLQQRLKRRGRNAFYNSNSSETIYPELRSGYRILSPQSLDIVVDGNFAESGNTQRYSIIGGRDIGLSNMRFFLAGFNDDILNSSRVSFTRESMQADLLGPLNASQIVVGDVTPVRTPGRRTFNQGRGIYLSNNRLGRNNDFDVTTLAGEIQSDWDVELYRNDVLIDRQLNIQTGRYEFNDIPLLSGNNTLELRFFGPQGQRYSEVVEKVVDNALNNRQKLGYEFSISQIGRSLLGQEFGNDSDSTGAISIDGKYSYGLLDNVRVSLGHSSIINSENNVNLLSAGVDAKLSDTLLANIETSAGDNGALFIESSLRSRIFGQNLRLSYNHIKDSEDAEARDSVRLINDGKLGESIEISYLNELEYSEQAEDSFTRLSNSIGTRLGRVRVNNRVAFNQIKTDIEESQFIDGSLGMDFSVGPTFFRFATNYSDIEGFNIDSLQAEVDWNINPSLSSNFRYTKTLLNDTSRYQFGMEYKHDYFYVGLNSFYDELANWNVGLTARMSLGYEDDDDLVYASNRSLATRGVIFVRAFDDENANFEYDEGEPLLENIKFVANQGGSRAETNGIGIAMLQGLADHVPTDITFDSRSVTDPFLRPWLEGFSITPRFGLSQTIDFPFVQTIEVDGFARVVKPDGAIIELKGARVILTNQESGNIYSTISSFDGFYYFDGILPGNYLLSYAENTINRFNLKPSPAIEITVNVGDEYVSDIEITANEKIKHEGYFASHGAFKNKAIAIVFARSLKSRKPQLNLHIVDDLINKQFSVVSAYFTQNQNAKRWCDTNFSTTNCQVVPKTSFL